MHIIKSPRFCGAGLSFGCGRWAGPALNRKQGALWVKHKKSEIFREIPAHGSKNAVSGPKRFVDLAGIITDIIPSTAVLFLTKPIFLSMICYKPLANSWLLVVS